MLRNAKCQSAWICWNAEQASVACKRPWGNTSYWGSLWNGDDYQRHSQSSLAPVASLWKSSVLWESSCCEMFVSVATRLVFSPCNIEPVQGTLGIGTVGGWTKGRVWGRKSGRREMGLEALLGLNSSLVGLYLVVQRQETECRPVSMRSSQL